MSDSAQGSDGQAVKWNEEEGRFLDEYMLPRDFSELSREKIVLGLIKKHSDRIAQMKVELEKSQRLAQDNKPLVEESRAARDELNRKVHDLKDQRDTLLREIRALKTEFFNILDNEGRDDKAADKLSKHKKHLSELDWKLQTEGITIEDERKIMGEIRGVLGEMHTLARPQLRMDEITKTIAEKFTQMQAAHEQMIANVKESDVVHQKFMKLLEEYNTSLKNIRWLPHRIELSQETLKYWMDRLQGKLEPTKTAPMLAPGEVEAQIATASTPAVSTEAPAPSTQAAEPANASESKKEA